MKRCRNGHYYDEGKHSFCPHCGVNIDLNLGVTMPKQPTPSEDLAKTQAVFPNGKGVEQTPKAVGKTVAFYGKEIGIDPVVGWLVCITGPNKGKDYRIRSERNFIGRSEKMDINIDGDEGISRENHAIISYSPKKRLFRIYPGDSRGLVYLNDEEVILAEELKPYDIVELGKTRLMFIPFCGEKFEWS